MQFMILVSNDRMRKYDYRIKILWIFNPVKRQWTFYNLILLQKKN